MSIPGIKINCKTQGIGDTSVNQFHKAGQKKIGGKDDTQFTGG